VLIFYHLRHLESLNDWPANAASAILRQILRARSRA
jgi:hypothetical protein